MTVCDIMDLFLEDCQEVCIYDLASGQVLYRGAWNEIGALGGYGLLEVCSIDTMYEATTCITLNVDSTAQ